MHVLGLSAKKRVDAPVADLKVPIHLLVVQYVLYHALIVIRRNHTNGPIVLQGGRSLDFCKNPVLFIHGASWKFKKSFSRTVQWDGLQLPS